MNLLPREKEAKTNTLVKINKNDTGSKKGGEKRNSNKNKDYNEIKNLEQMSYLSNNKLDISNFEENKIDFNLKLQKPATEIKINFNNSPILNNNKNNYNFFGGATGGFSDDMMNNSNNENIPSDFHSNNIEEEKIDFSQPNASILGPNSKNTVNKSNNNINNNNKFSNKQAENNNNNNNYKNNNKIKKNFFEQEEVKNSYLANNEEDNDGSGIDFFNNNNNNENQRINKLNLPDSPEIRKKHTLKKLLNPINLSNNNSYFDNNISVIHNMESGNLMDAHNNNIFEKQKTSSEIAFNELNALYIDNKQIGDFSNSKVNNNNISSFNYNNKNVVSLNVNDKSNLNVSGNNVAINDRKNTSNNNVGKSKLTDNIVKGKNMKNFATILMKKKSILIFF